MIVQIVAHIDAIFMLTYWPPGVYRDYGLWRAVLYIEDEDIPDEGTSAEYAIRGCLQKYALRHTGELPFPSTPLND
jgi:hypothetical protein